MPLKLFRNPDVIFFQNPFYVKEQLLYKRKLIYSWNYTTDL